MIDPITGIMLGLKIVNTLAPALMPRMISIARSVKGMTTDQIMTIDEFEKSINETMASVKKWEDPI